MVDKLVRLPDKLTVSYAEMASENYCYCCVSELFRTRFRLGIRVEIGL